MTHQDLRDLLHEQVADLETTDLAGRAWSDAVRRRRRGRLVAAGATALVTVLVVAGVAVVRDRVDDPPRRTPAPVGPPPWVTQSPPAAPSAADTSYQDLPVWWSPDLDEELALPFVGRLPFFRHLDPSRVDADLVEDPTIDRAIAAFGRDDVVVLVDPEGQTRRVTIDLPAPADDADGNPTSRFGPSMLSPDGRRLEVRQGDDRAVLDIGTGAWRDLRGPGDPPPTGPAVVDLQPAMLNPAGRMSVNERGASAQSWGMGPGIPVRDPAAYFSGPAYLVVSGRDEGPSLLAFMTGLDDERWMDAPTVAGWLDDDTVVYESIAEDRDLLISWKVGTHTFRRVGAISPGWTSSFARLADQR
ncbi:hypothetical protein [Nocardioides conyzicola]|uniref:Uncharacterized protein n=1 Tax=Nocardioides conyzicola TaxID=1651781 RepID=A0ABP8XJC4_9ACTN